MKLAIIGSGGIVQEALSALQALPQIEKTAIFARPHSKAKAEALAKEYGIGEIYTDYAELIQKSAADFVYIGLVNSAHYEYTKEALLNGKNVILEKPFTPTLAEAAELASLAKERELYLFEAVTPLHLPNYQGIKDSLPKLGAVRLVQANYSQYSSRYDAYLHGKVLPAFDPMYAGGALYDINIYNLNLLVSLFGRPATVDYEARLGFNGIDTSGVVTLRYGGFIAVSVGAKDSASPCAFTVQGEKGWLRVNGAPNELASFDLCLDGKTETINLNPPGHRMENEFREFAEVYEAKDYNQMAAWLTTSVQVMEVAQEARKKAGILFPTDKVEQ